MLCELRCGTVHPAEVGLGVRIDEQRNNQHNSISVRHGVCIVRRSSQIARKNQHRQLLQAQTFWLEASRQLPGSSSPAKLSET